VLTRAAIFFAEGGTSALGPLPGRLASRTAVSETRTHVRLMPRQPLLFSASIGSDAAVPLNRIGRRSPARRSIFAKKNTHRRWASCGAAGAFPFFNQLFHEHPTSRQAHCPLAQPRVAVIAPSHSQAGASSRSTACGRSAAGARRRHRLPEARGRFLELRPAALLEPYSVGRVGDAAVRDFIFRSRRKAPRARADGHRLDAVRPHAATHPRVSRAAIFERDKGVCQYSGEFVGQHGGNLDHVVPRDRVAAMRSGNLVWSKKEINSHKANVSRTKPPAPHAQPAGVETAPGLRDCARTAPPGLAAFYPPLINRSVALRAPRCSPDRPQLFTLS